MRDLINGWVPGAMGRRIGRFAGVARAAPGVRIMGRELDRRRNEKRGRRPRTLRRIGATRDFLHELRVPVVRYVSVEIDPAARRMADWRYLAGFADTQPPNDRFLGHDVNNLHKGHLRWLWGKGEGVLVVGGIPCTSLSTANAAHKGAGGWRRGRRRATGCGRSPPFWTRSRRQSGWQNALPQTWRIPSLTGIWGRRRA